MSGKKWVLLVAGSKGWDNYRHQANVCCAYQRIKQNGIPDEQIVVMMFDDIANNTKNPNQGKIISVINQENVYTGVTKDYTRHDVNPDNFLAVLQGEGSAVGGKVIKSGSNDEIFVYMSGLGNNGIFYFPEDQAELSATDLIKGINNMSTKKQFSKMAIYMDSDYSGSMFETLSTINNVYAVTSCDENNKNSPSDSNKILKVNLSDQFSSALLTFLYSHDVSSATLKGLFDFISSKANPPPRQYWDMEINECHLSEFLKN